jgi:hypothetical protein
VEIFFATIPKLLPRCLQSNGSNTLFSIISKQKQAKTKAATTAKKSINTKHLFPQLKSTAQVLRV